MRNIVVILIILFGLNLQAQESNKKLTIRPSVMILTGSSLLFTHHVSNIIYPSQNQGVTTYIKDKPRWLEPTRGFLFFFGATITIQGIFYSKRETYIPD